MKILDTCRCGHSRSEHSIGGAYIRARCKATACQCISFVYSGEEAFPEKPAAVMRTFPSGATRNTDEEKPDYEGFISPLVTKRYGQYMHTHRVQADGRLRDGDNWQRGMSKDSYIKSLTRHLEDVRLHHRGYGDVAVEPLEVALCAVIFNASGYLYELLKEQRANANPSQP